MSVTYHQHAQVRTRIMDCVRTIVRAMDDQARDRAEDELAAGHLDVTVHDGGRDLLLEVRLGPEAWPLCAMWLTDLGAHVLPDLDDGAELVLLDEPLHQPFVTCYPWPPEATAA